MEVYQFKRNMRRISGLKAIGTLGQNDLENPLRSIYTQRNINYLSCCHIKQLYKVRKNNIN